MQDKLHESELALTLEVDMSQTVSSFLLQIYSSVY